MANKLIIKEPEYKTVEDACWSPNAMMEEMIKGKISRGAYAIYLFLINAWEEVDILWFQEKLNLSKRTIYYKRKELIKAGYLKDEKGFVIATDHREEILELRKELAKELENG